MKRLLTLVLLLWVWSAAAQSIAPSEALRHYIDNGDDTFAWQLRDSLVKDDVTAYRLRMRSQTWREKEWIHELVIIVPRHISHPETLIHISGGSANEQTGEPNYHSWDDTLIGFMGDIASRSQALTAILWQVPRQPLDGGMTEDELVYDEE